MTNSIAMSEALALTTMDLDHGDGHRRGRWVKMVYLRCGEKTDPPRGGSVCK